jgi:hypothetical protein
MRQRTVLAPLLGATALLLYSGRLQTDSQRMYYEAAGAADQAWSAVAEAFPAGGSPSVDTRAIAAALEGFRANTRLHVESAAAQSAAAQPQAPSGSAATSAAPAGPCLVSKWESVWVLTRGRSRTFVQYPTTECLARASPVEDLDKYPKAHGGVGAYLLGTDESSAACKLAGCWSAPAAARSEAAVAPEAAPPVGVQAGWMERAALRFNGAARESFASLQLEAGEPLLLVFGGASVSDMLLNWALHVQQLRIAHVVACMDSSLFGIAERQALPAVMLKAHDDVATRWKYYRMDPKVTRRRCQPQNAIVTVYLPI